MLHHLLADFESFICMMLLALVLPAAFAGLYLMLVCKITGITSPDPNTAWLTVVVLAVSNLVLMAWVHLIVNALFEPVEFQNVNSERVPVYSTTATVVRYAGMLVTSTLWSVFLFWSELRTTVRRALVAWVIWGGTFVVLAIAMLSAPIIDK